MLRVRVALNDALQLGDGKRVVDARLVALYHAERHRLGVAHSERQSYAHAHANAHRHCIADGVQFRDDHSDAVHLADGVSRDAHRKQHGHASAVGLPQFWSRGDLTGSAANVVDQTVRQQRRQSLQQLWRVAASICLGGRIVDLCCERVVYVLARHRVLPE